MRKIAGLLNILALTVAFSASAMAAGKQKIVLKAPKGGNHAGKLGYVLKGNDWNAKLVHYKAQNHLSTATNQLILKQQKGASFNNGTIDTVPYFNSWFITGSRNSIYTYSMVGHSPKAGGTTGINNRILPLEVKLTDLLGNVLYDFDPTALNDPEGSDADLASKSPLYDATTTYPGPPADTGQVIDTAQRVEFRSVRAANWHTPLNPAQFDQAYVVTLDPTAWSYLIDSHNNIVGVAFDLTVMSAVFELLLQTENSLVGLPNDIVPIILTDYLTGYDSGGCCVLGFHSAETGIANPAGVLVWTWATYIPHSASNPFGAFGEDTMVLSHELSELYNDPFVQVGGTAISPWVDGSDQFAQGNLETGDVIEAMNSADVIYNVALNPNGQPYTYNLQNVATLEWFSRNPFSGGIYSWPNVHTLGQSPHLPNCTAGPFVCTGYGQGSAGFYFGPPY